MRANPVLAGALACLCLPQFQGRQSVPEVEMAGGFQSYTDAWGQGQEQQEVKGAHPSLQPGCYLLPAMILRY